MENLELYEAVRSVPPEAQKPIKGGRISGMTDINPMWRIKTLTEHFGPCGIGWHYNVSRKWLESSGSETAAFVDIELYIRVDGEWSKPIHGTGGSMFATMEKSGIHVSDECYKMATTDAISVACKQLGIGADIYWGSDRTKYDNALPPDNRVSKKQADSLFAELKRTGIGLKGIMGKYGISDIQSLSPDNWKDAMETLKKKPNREDATRPPEHQEDDGLPWNNPGE